MARRSPSAQLAVRWDSPTKAERRPISSAPSVNCTRPCAIQRRNLPQRRFHDSFQLAGAKLKMGVPMQTILVIDDDESLRDTIGLMLEKEGFRPVLVADGIAGLEQAQAAAPNLILIDLRMPGL